MCLLGMRSTILHGKKPHGEKSDIEKSFDMNLNGFLLTGYSEYIWTS